VTESVLAKLAALPKAETKVLRARWRELFGAEPPPVGRKYLQSRLAYRIQELAYGGLSAAAQAQIDVLVADEDARINGKPRARVLRDRPIAGTRLIREWKGVEHQVTVLTDGFEYQGQNYKSLSAIARRIAGTRWNGPVFFGLRKPGKAEAAR
jgi:hypothetical protein